MTLCLHLLLFAAVLATAQTAPPAKGSVEGRVTNLAGAPLKKAEVSLRPQSSGGAAPYTAVSDANGNFSLHDVPAGTFTLSASRVGYVDFFYRKDALKLEAGGHLKVLEIQMTPQGLIFGKVIDEDGDPLPNVQVTAGRWTYWNGARQLRSNYGTSQADGSFRVRQSGARALPDERVDASRRAGHTRRRWPEP